MSVGGMRVAMGRVNSTMYEEFDLGKIFDCPLSRLN